MDPIPLTQLFRRALQSASQVHDIPTVDAQDLIQSCLTDLRTVKSRVVALSLFSPNESLEDISTRDLVYLFVPWVHSEVLGRVRTTEKEKRLSGLRNAQRHLHQFLASMEVYSIVPAPELELHERRTSSVADPAKRRELKIKQYQQQKELRARIEAIRKRRRAPHAQPQSGSDFDLIASLLPAPTTTSLVEEDQGEDSDTDALLRETALLLLRLIYAQTHAQLESMDQELELLKTMPPDPVRAGTRVQEGRNDEGKKKAEADTWRLEAPQPSAQGPLLDPQGKLLRSVTILPAGSTDRERAKARVFAPDHNLPTMSIDEYLEIERARGGLISGGGPQTGLTSSEQLAQDAEQDGTVFGAEKAEIKRLKDEEWAQFKDMNPKGAGNTMNRGGASASRSTVPARKFRSRSSLRTR